ncbi:PREDICTED: uncharacterized protein LOC104815599 isoform X2 [Tarenaya hassleriana]|uniref:uncharacterized protein LOC104815599 isoform X2 n=1 Tax=Tarenaya hassleriana TaxID=28532 RepID=UPI00053C1EBD|nr:PREDICTED: uncharacterized protein LOC104815599 isoform X2 [Tarenaya hassleriana]
MAYSCQLRIPPCLVPTPVRRRSTSMFQQSQLQVKKAAVPHPQPVRFSPKNKVFEDLAQGVVCYRDENGEIICEGYDEGPRCLPQSSRTACYSSYQELIDAGKNHRQMSAPQQGLMMMKWNSFDLF